MSVSYFLVSFFRSNQLIYCFSYSNDSLPWNQQTVIGWMGAIIFTLITITMKVHVFLVCMNLLCGATLYLYAFYQSFKALYKDIENEIAENKSGNNMRSKELICRVIQLHITAKE